MEYQESHSDYEKLEVPYYKGGKLRLIEPHLEHAVVGLNWVSNHETIQYMGADFSNPSLEKEQKRLREIIENKDAYSWMIELDGKVIGNLTLGDIQEKSSESGMRTGNFTILIGDKNYWGKGIAFAVSRKVLDWAFHKAGFRKIVARALELNVGSIKTLQKLGFQETGTTPYEGLVNSNQTVWHNFELLQ